MGKVALEGVGGPVFFRGFGFVAPDEEGVVVIAAGSTLPFGFGWEAFAGPFAVGFGIFFGDADHGVIHFVGDRAVGSSRVLPVGSGDELPPLPFGTRLPLFDFGSGGFEDEGSGFELFGGSFGEVFLSKTALGLSFVSGGLNEFCELGVGDFGAVDEEGGDRDFMHGLFFGVASGAAEAAVFAPSVGAS